MFWFLFQHLLKKRQNGPDKALDPELESSFERSRIILEEMNAIAERLEINLEEKRDLSRDILKQLDDGLKRAKESSIEIQKIIHEYSTDMAMVDGSQDTEKTKLLIKDLVSKGMTRQEISKKLDVPMGEIELMLKL